MNLRILICLLLAIIPAVSVRGEAAPKPKPETAATPPELPQAKSLELEAALGKLAMPGVKINLKERCVDVESRVCLKQGLLELIACTKDSKEHESIIMIEAKPSHIHTALLLLGAKPGSPATQQVIDDDLMRFRSTPPSGTPVDVFLVTKDAEGKETEKPISDFIKPAEGHNGAEGRNDPNHKEKFPTHTFLFAGSVLVGEGEGPRRYLGDLNGNVISIATFGDELLCLPGIHEQANGALMWRVDGDKLPELDSKITLRLRPQIKP